LGWVGLVVQDLDAELTKAEEDAVLAAAQDPDSAADADGADSSANPTSTSTTINQSPAKPLAAAVPDAAKAQAAAAARAGGWQKQSVTLREMIKAGKQKKLAAPAKTGIDMSKMS
jgi:hypothetical protein